MTYMLQQQKKRQLLSQPSILKTKKEAQCSICFFNVLIK